MFNKKTKANGTSLTEPEKKIEKLWSETYFEPLKPLKVPCLYLPD